MKKILAIAITVMMLLTMAVVMPVSAASLTTVGPNLITNSGFETDAVDKSAEIAGWEHVNADNKMYLWNTVGSGYNPPSDGSFVVYVGKNSATAGLKQTITLDETADWYTNQDKYAFDLVADMYGGNGNTYIKATVYNADKSESVTQTFNHTSGEPISGLNTGYYSLTGNKMNYDITVGFTGLIASLNATAKYIEIEMGTSNEGSWDNVRLIPRLNLVTNGSFEADTGQTYVSASNPAGNTTITGWTRTSATPYYRVINRFRHYLVPNDGFNLIQAEAGVDTIMQEITLDSTADYYANQKNYSFEISYWYYHNARITVTVYSPDKSTSRSITVSPGAAAGGAGYFMRRASMTLDDAIAQVGKVKYITIELSSPGTQSGWDNIVLTPVPKAVEEDNNMLANAGFENVTEGALDSWKVVEATETHNLLSVETDADLSPEGFNNIVLTNVQGIVIDEEKGTTANYGGTVTQDVNVEKGKAYIFEFRYKANMEQAALVTLSNKRNWNKVLETAPAASTGWSKAKYLIRPTEEISMLEIALRCHPHTVDAIAHFDDVKFYEIPAQADADNLIFNGDFELDDVGFAALGWTSSSSASLVETSTGGAAQGKNVLKQYGANVAQTVSITDIDMMYSDNCKYTFKFDYASPAGGRLGVTVKYAYEDSTQDKSVIYTAVRLDAEGNIGTSEYTDAYAGPALEAGTYFTHSIGADYDPISIDLRGTMPATTSPLKSITVQFNAVGTACYIDNVALYCDKSAVEIVDANGAAVADVATNAAAAYTAKATYYGTDAGAMSWIVVYTKDANGVLRLANVASAAVTGDGVANTSATLTGVNAIAGTTVVKAFILGTENNSVASAMID